MSSRGISEKAYNTLGLLAPFVKGKFYLGGGTGAAVQLNHRLSHDLDFFSAAEFDNREIINFLEKNASSYKILSNPLHTCHCLVNGVNVSFFFYPYPLLQPPITFNNVEVASLLDIALMKITAIGGRGSKKDFIDLYFILNHIHINNIFELFSRKFSLDKFDPYFYLKSLVYFEDAEKEADPVMLVDYNWSEIKNYFIKLVKKEAKFWKQN